MSLLFDSMKARAVAALVLFLSASHLLALLVFANRSTDANNLLHDALVAEQVAQVAKLVEGTPPADREGLLGRIDAPSLRVAAIAKPELRSGLPEGSRPHNFEHLIGAYLGRPIAQSVRLAYAETGHANGLEEILHRQGASTGFRSEELEHVPMEALNEIGSSGTVQAEVRLNDNSWLRFEAPLLSVSPFSTWKFGASLLVGLASVALVGTWVMIRWTQPLTTFASAAERLGRDIKSPPLAEAGPSEVRSAAKAFNRMQEQLGRLIDDRTQLAAAIAHDLGTPITRLRLRAEEIEDAEQRGKILADLMQMQRMIGATLDFARQELVIEPLEAVDISSVLQSICDDFTDLGGNLHLEAPSRVTARLRPYAIRRALSNVIDNALKYGNRARIRLCVSAKGHTIIVDDDGPGIPDEGKAECFKPFRRLAPAKHGVEGTGLGLAVARTIVRDHGGDIDLINRPEGGLRVQITLPPVPED